MRKAVVVGGSNGIGLAISKNLINRGYHVLVLDIVEPEQRYFQNTENFTYYPCNLLEFDDDLFRNLSQKEEVDVLMITAGLGRVANFEYLHPVEIQNMLQVNTTAGIKIIRYFYEKIKNEKHFYCGLMGSIAGFISSPLFSVYAASKAALCRFIESINIELEVSGTKNRILNISPGFINGTKFNGGHNDLTITNELAEKIVTNLFNSKDLYIPQYEELYKSVIQQYQTNAHDYGIHSYLFKKTSGRILNEKRVKIGYLSGTFDLFHVGHLNLLKRAKQQCDYLIVGIHPSAVHKGKVTFIPYEERKAIVKAVKYVDKVVESCTEDSDAWKLWNFDKLFVGSDYKGTERFNRYEAFFLNKNVEIVYFPYTQGRNSTQIRETVLSKSAEIEKEQAGGKYNGQPK